MLNGPDSSNEKLKKNQKKKKKKKKKLEIKLKKKKTPGRTPSFVLNAMFEIPTLKHNKVI